MLKKFIKYFALTKDDRRFIQFSSENSALEKTVKPEYKKTILIDCSHALYPKWQMKNFLIAQTKRDNYAIHTLYPSKAIVWSAPKVWLLGFVKKFYNKDLKLIKAMGSDKIVFLGASDVIRWAVCLHSAKRIAKKLHTKTDVLDLKINGLAVGDLIYDTYLKRYRVPTVDVNDTKLIRVIALAYYCHYKIEKILAKNKYEEIYLTHAVYVFFGLMARLGLQYNARVFVVQNNRGLFVQRLTPDHPLQTPRFESYRDGLGNLSTQEIESRRIEARSRLEDRLAGKIDSSISYMRKSAYGNSASISHLDDAFVGRPRVLMLLHCFFDSPHIYKWMLYEDFFEWVMDTLEFLEKQRVNVIVKEHPNGMAGNDRILKKLKARFTKAQFVSKQTNTKKIIEEKRPLFALTVYGTMAHELAYMGLPVINAGDNPHLLFNFSKTPRTKSEYKDFMLGLLEGNPFDIEKTEVEDFYYAHYLSPKPGFSSAFDDSIEKNFNLQSGYREILAELTVEKVAVLRQEAKFAINETDKYENVV